jgi:hypothetical protein
MVCVRMGLLDDAIREHLELKRQRGADPGEVAREQREALDASVQGTTAEDEPLAADVASAAPLVDPPTAAQPDVDPGTDVVEENASTRPSEQASASDTTFGGETAELDMSSVLGEDAGAAADQAAPGSSADDADTPVEAADPALTQEDSLEWEMPSETAAADAEVEEPAEDVLEETPEFLRDTPEQERLWFEQRPPRDFDFDK